MNPIKTQSAIYIQIYIYKYTLYKYTLYIYIFFAFLVKKTYGILFFGPSFRKPARKASSGEIYLKNKDLYATDL